MYGLELDFKKEDKVRVVSRKSKFGEGLRYKAGVYTMLEDGFSGGHDVWHCLNSEGQKSAIYGFSIEGSSRIKGFAQVSLIENGTSCGLKTRSFWRFKSSLGHHISRR